MKILVCVKQVPNTNEVKINPKTGTLIRDGVESILNPDDDNALEAALQMKDGNADTTVTVITMGPPQAKEVLVECMAKGADDSVLLSSRAFGGADTWATSNTIAGAAIRESLVQDVYLRDDRPLTGIRPRWDLRLRRSWGSPRLRMWSVSYPVMAKR